MKSCQEYVAATETLGESALNTLCLCLELVCFVAAQVCKEGSGHVQLSPGSEDTLPILTVGPMDGGGRGMPLLLHIGRPRDLPQQLQGFLM